MISLKSPILYLGPSINTNSFLLSSMMEFIHETVPCTTTLGFALKALFGLSFLSVSCFYYLEIYAKFNASNGDLQNLLVSAP